MHMRKALPALAAVLTLLVAAGCSGSGDDAKGTSTAARAATPIHIGTKNFTEQYILGELYKQALEAKGFRVQLKSDIGASEIIDQALLGGGIDMYPEYMGVLLSEIANERMRPRTAAAAYRAAKAFEERRGFTLLEPTPFTDSNALAVRPVTARRDRIRSIADLDRVAGGPTIAAPPEVSTRFEGPGGVEGVYGLKRVRVRPLPIGRQYDALQNGSVDAAAVFTTDGQLAGEGFRILDDPHGLFAAQHVAPVISKRALKGGGAALSSTIDAVSHRLTTKAMREMSAAVQLRKQRPAAVSDTFLRSRDLK